MQFANILLLGATLSAPVAQAIIAFTQTPGSVQAGVPTLIKWSGNVVTESTTITLKNGNSGDLQTVNIIDSCKNIKTDSCTWTPSSTLTNGNYALQIEQGNDTPNYSGMFGLTGGSKKAASVSTTSSASLSSTSTKSASTTVTKTTPLAALPHGKTSSSSSASTTVTHLTPLASIAGNATTLAPKNGTAPTTVLLGTGVGTGASSAGTGTALHRNMTMSKATLSTTKTSSTTAKSTTEGTTTSSSTGGSSSSTAAADSAAFQIGSPVALILSVFAAVVYLG